MDQPTINIILKNIQGSPFTSKNESVAFEKLGGHMDLILQKK